MPEWWTYSPSDFVMFSPQVYYRMLERYHRAIWPLQLATLAAGLWMFTALPHRRADWSRPVFALLAACWAWVAWAFHLRRYAEFNWPARWFAAAFAAEALLLAVAAFRGRTRIAAAVGTRARIATALCAFALLLEPLVGPLAGRTWLQLELFGITPDPTAAATLALLISAERVPRGLILLPTLWCVVSALTLWVLGSPEAAILGAVALVGVSSMLRSRR